MRVKNELLWTAKSGKAENAPVVATISLLLQDILSTEFHFVILFLIRIAEDFVRDGSPQPSNSSPDLPLSGSKRAASAPLSSSPCRVRRDIYQENSELVGEFFALLQVIYTSK